jgi:hypothetical protein
MFITAQEKFQQVPKEVMQHAKPLSATQLAAFNATVTWQIRELPPRRTQPPYLLAYDLQMLLKLSRGENVDARAASPVASFVPVAASVLTAVPILASALVPMAAPVSTPVHMPVPLAQPAADVYPTMAGYQVPRASPSTNVDADPYRARMLGLALDHE